MTNVGPNADRTPKDLGSAPSHSPAQGISAHDASPVREDRTAGELRPRAQATDIEQIIWVTNAEGLLVEDNLSWRAFTGQSRADLMGLGWLLPIHPEDQEKTRAAWRRASAAKTIFSAEHRLRRHDGVYRAFFTTGTPVMNPDGTLREWIGASTDITDKKQLELELRLSEERFRSTIDGAPNGMAIVGLDGRWLTVNRVICEIVGYTRDELLKADFQTITHPDDLNTDLALLGQLLRGEIPRYEMPKRYIRKDGSIVHVELFVSLVRNKDGAPVYFISQVQDVTERKRAQEAQRINDERFRLLTTHLPVGVFQTDADGRSTYVNERWHALSGLTRGEAVGTAWVNAVHPEDRERVTDAWRSALEEQHELSTECRLQTRAGDVFWISASVVPMRDEAGKVIGYFGSLTDITELKSAEEHARGSQERLIQAQRAALAELSTPLIPINNEVMVMPLIGGVDKQRADRVLTTLLAGIGANRTRVAILDITGVPAMDTQVANAIIGLAQAVRLLGSQIVVSGIRPEVAQTLVGIGADLSGIVTVGNLQAAINYAMGLSRGRALR